MNVTNERARRLGRDDNPPPPEGLRLDSMSIARLNVVRDDIARLNAINVADS